MGADRKGRGVRRGGAGASGPEKARSPSGKEALPAWVEYSGFEIDGLRGTGGVPSRDEGMSSSADDRPNARFVVLSVAEYAGLFRVSTKTVRRMIDRGELHAARIGRSLRIPVSLDFVNTVSTEPHCFR